MQFTEIKRDSKKINGNVNELMDKVFSDIRIPFKEQNECMVKTEKSIHQDYQISKSLKSSKAKLYTPTSKATDEDDTLNLSPIHRSENSFIDNTYDVKRQVYTEVQRNYERDSVAASVVPPLFKSSYQITRKRKYNANNVAPSENIISEKPVSKLTKSRYSFSEKLIRPKKEVHTFKDLFQYENFQDIIKPVQEETDHEESLHNSVFDIDKRRSSQAVSLKNKFYLPKAEESMSIYNSTYYEATNAQPVDSENRKSKVRRYGKNKYTAINDINMTSRLSATSTFDRRNDRTLTVGINEEDYEMESKFVEPIFKNVSHRENRISNGRSNDRIHVYEVDPMVVEYGPGQVDTFREKKAYKTSIGRDIVYLELIIYFI